jgi:long-subunit acyl-CoA synthetase (AMP-forming)
MFTTKTLLDYAQDHESANPGRLYLTQPVGGGAVADYTWGQVMDQARRMAAHLQGMGLPRGARVAILSKNCAHFVMAELAIWMGGYTTVAIFPTESAETIRYVLGHSEASALFVGKLDTWDQQKPGVPAGMPCMAFPLAPASALKEYPTWDDIVARTPPLAGRHSRALDELAMLIYTSGSTGTPKGVMVNFNSFARASEGVAQYLRHRLGNNEECRVLSYLPLAHSMDRTWSEGASIADGNVHLYFAEALDTFVQDLQRARPTIFASVPRLWTKFQQGVFSKMPPEKLDRLLGIPILGRIVAKKVLKGLGLDAVKMAGSGSAPLPADLIRWYRRLGLKLYEGYGMTEDNSYSHFSDESHGEPGYVGVPLPGVEVKLSPEGEVLIKSPGQFNGYYKQPELTAECFTDDGFFRTGDLGERRPDGLLKLTGRAKELFKTAKGKYVAPAPIENRLNAHPMVELSLVSGVGQPAAYAMVILAEDLRPRMHDEAERKRVETELEALLKRTNAEIADYESLHMIVVAREPWSIENGLLTPTMKVRRARIEKVAEEHVEKWYATGRRVHWH